MLLVIMITGCSCGPAKVRMPDDVQAFYYEYFQLVGNQKETSGTIMLDKNMTTDMVGKCDWNLFGPWTIYLSQSVWLKASDNYKRALVFHELTHCTFKSAAHSSDPFSYMYSAASASSEEEENEQVVDYTSNL